MEMLDSLDDAEREKTLSTFQRFVEWIQSVFSHIFSRIADTLAGLWNKLFG